MRESGAAEVVRCWMPPIVLAIPAGRCSPPPIAHGAVPHSGLYGVNVIPGVVLPRRACDGSARNADIDASELFGIAVRTALRRVRPASYPRTGSPACSSAESRQEIALVVYSYRSATIDFRHREKRPRYSPCSVLSCSSVQRGEYSLSSEAASNRRLRIVRQMLLQ